MSSGRVLITEDEAIVAEDLRATLVSLGYSVVAVADSAEDSVSLAARTRPDVVLMDIKLRGAGDGISAAEQIRKTLGLPVIFLTAHADPATLSRARSAFPFAYLVKPFEEQGLRASIEMALQLHEAQSKLEKTERWLSTTLQSIGDGVISVDLDERITFMNAKAEQITGWVVADARGRRFEDVFPVCRSGENEPLPHPVGQALRGARLVTLPENAVLRWSDGRELPVEDCAAPIRDASGTISGAVLVFRDATARREAEAERQRMEQKLQAAERLESLGILAGGIAHDFNNLLAAILANASLGRVHLAEDSPAQANLREIEVTSLRAAELCRQMLAYAGKGRREVTQFDLSTLVAETADLLRASISKKTALHLVPDRNLPLLEGDQSQIRQVILNLVINASDALEGRDGIVALRTTLVWADRALLASFVQAEDLPEGNYVHLEVSDTGCGMPPETIARIFNPFFTTKFAGRGLGLASVYGIVRGHRGALRVESEVGRGSVFSVLLPASSARQTTSAPPPDREGAGWRGSGTVLVVDDEAVTREAIALLLKRLGFEVVEAVNGKEALERLAAAEATFRVALLDLTMPQLDGVETLERLRATHGDLPVVLMTGYSEDVASSALRDLKVAAFLQKPFTPGALRDTLAAILRQEAK